MSKKMLSIEDIEGQTALALPERKMMQLVDVTIVNVLNNNVITIQLPLAVAANVCGISVASIVAQGFKCTAGAGARANN